MASADVVVDAVQPGFRRHVPGDAEDELALVTFLTSNHWPFHVDPHVSEELARARLSDYDGTKDRMFWVEVDGEVTGFVRAMDIGDGDPQVDIRLGEGWRGRGLGRVAVRQLVGEVFAEFDDVHRIEATARRDNIASRRTLRACGFVKEAVYRLAYEPYVTEPPGRGADPPAGTGSPLDSIGYAVLRCDWESGQSTPVDWDEEP